MADTAELAIVHATTASASWLTDPTVFAANRKPAHSSHRYVIGETSEPKQSLDGEWKVRIEQARNVDVESAPFAAVDFEDGDFGAIEVPGHLQMAGYLKNKYVNIQYPWDGHEDPQAPNIPENNHVAIYRRRFALDAQLARTLENDGTVSLTFHGAATAIYVWLDGTFVGYGEDGFTPSEFDVTEALRNGNGNAADSPEAEHTLTVACYEYSSASWLEDQDFWRLHGLFRTVELAAQPHTHVETVQLEADYTAADTAGTADTAELNAALTLRNPADAMTSGSEQQVDEGVFELRQELLPFWHGWCGCELVRPVLRESAFSFGLAQTGVRIDAERCGHGLRVGKRRVDLWRLLVLLILPNLRAIARSGIAVKIGMGLDGLIFLAIIHGDLLGSAAE